MFLSAFHGSNYNVRLMPAGKDKLRGYMPSLPAAARRFLICAESGKKQSRQARGTLQGLSPFRTHGKEYLRRKGLGILPIINFESGECCMKVNIKITEKLVRVVSVNAESIEEAKRKVEDEYSAGNIVLTADDFVSYTISKG